MRSITTWVGPLTLLVAAAGASGSLCACADREEGGAAEGGRAAGGEGGAAGGEGGAAAGGGGAATGGGGAASGSGRRILPPLEVERVTSGGNGCPEPRDLSVKVDRRAGILVLEYSAMKVFYPPGDTVKSIHCATGLRVRAVRGWQLAVAGMSAQGLASLPAGAEGGQSTSVHLPGAGHGPSTSVELMGAMSGPFSPAETVPARLLSWSACSSSTALAVNVGLTLKVRGGPLDRAAMNVTRVAIPIAWREC